MELKNYQEDLVLHVAEIVLNDRPDVRKSDGLLMDVAAYTLNRLPPRYILSERGFTRLAADHYGENGDSLAGLVEVLLLVNKAVDTIAGRRKPAAAPKPAGAGDGALLSYWHNLPYMIGRVADRGRPVIGAVVTLQVNGKPADPATESGWTNPYQTNAATRGFFSFLPKAVQAKALHRQFRLRLTCAHPDYREATLERTIRTQGEYSPLSRIEGDHILNLGTVSLSPRRPGS
jgi:competence protein ComFB